MLTFLAPRTLFQLFLAAAALATFSRTGSAELPKYLPDGCNLIFAINFAEVHDGPYYQKLKTDIADFARGENSFQEEIGLDPANLAHVSWPGTAATGRDGGRS